MTATTEVIGPVVRMCASAQCGGPNACGEIRPDAFIGFTAWLAPGLMTDDTLIAYFTQELIFSCASDSHGTEHVIPDGMEFTVHKGSAGIPVKNWRGGLPLEAFTVLYGGDAATRDEALNGAPEYLTGSEPMARLVPLRDTGRLQALETFPERYAFSGRYARYWEL